MPITIKTLIACLACGLAVPSAGLADVYKYRDVFGRILLTDQPTRGMKLVQRFSISTGRPAQQSSGGISALAEMNRRREQLDPLIERAAAESQLRPALVHAVVRAESAYRADAVSSKGAVGLMQLMPGTAERYGVEDRQNAEQNLRGGTLYLRDLLEMFDHDLQLALAAYNAGENAVIRYGNQIPPYAETQGYVRKVINFYNALKDADKVALR